MSKIVGIDLGSTNSCICVMEGGVPTVIKNAEGNDCTPSVVAYKKDGERLVGISAKRQQALNSQNSINTIKRFIGKKYDEVKEQASKVTYKVKANKKGLAVVEIPNLNNKELTPEEISASILSKLKADAEAYLGEKITQAVITVPAYFTNSSKAQTKVAGEIAGLEVLRIISEPVAGILAYGFGKEKEGYILCVDLGGSTYDVSLLQLGDNVHEVIATSGDNYLGGDDFDHKITEWILKEIKAQKGVDLKNDLACRQRIIEASEKAKVELSSQMSTNINLPYITSIDNNPEHFDIDLTRAKFEDITKDLFEKLKQPILDVLNDSKIDKSLIKEVVLIGGSSRMNLVTTMVKALVGVEPSKGVSPDLAVGLGAAVQAGILQGDVKDLVLIDVTPLSLSIEVNHGLTDVLIPKNSSIPISKKSVYTTAEDNQQTVTIHAMQGMRPLAKDNRTLGVFNLDGLVPSRRGTPQIEVEFSIDVNNILEVRATDLATKKEQKITITQSSNLEQSEIDKMIKEAEEYAKQDEDAKSFILLKNELETICNSMDTTLEMAKDKVDSALIEPVTEALKTARESLLGDDREVITKAKEDLLKAAQPVSEELYKNVQTEQPQNSENFADNFQNAQTGSTTQSETKPEEPS